jgi:hypothetical protein
MVQFNLCTVVLKLRLEFCRLFRDAALASFSETPLLSEELIRHYVVNAIVDNRS